MPTPISLLVAYPKELIREGLRAMLEKSRIEVVAQADDEPSTLTLTKEHKPDVILLDAAIPGGDAFELVKKLRDASPGTKFVMMSALENPTYMARAQVAGVSNFLLKSVGRAELVRVIESAFAGKPPTGSGAFAQVTASMHSRDTRTLRDAGVTPREEQTLRHIALGLSNNEIADSLGISVETVKEHVQNLLRKLAVHDRTQAAVWAVKSGLV